MEFKLKIDCDNDAFHGTSCEGEVVRILEMLRYAIMIGDADTQRSITLLDINGNRVGTAEFKGKRL